MALSHRTIGGLTGDTLGAIEQAVECLVWWQSAGSHCITNSGGGERTLADDRRRRIRGVTCSAIGYPYA